MEEAIRKNLASALLLSKMIDCWCKNLLPTKKIIWDHMVKKNFIPQKIAPTPEKN